MSCILGICTSSRSPNRFIIVRGTRGLGPSLNRPKPPKEFDILAILPLISSCSIIGRTPAEELISFPGGDGAVSTSEVLASF
jgi:hypothetical protein